MRYAHMKYALTVDVEDWYHTKDFDLKSWEGCEDRIEKSTMNLLGLFEEHGVHGTFFILGCVAYKHPRLVREIAKRGHEIGSHGMNHILITSQNRKEFKEDLLASKAAIEEACGTEVSIYRSSSWSICSKTLWALEILEECGFLCDSSIQPFKTPLSGMSGAPRTPFHPVLHGKALNLIEFPSTVYKSFGSTIPFSGGFYLRFWPYILSRHWFKKAAVHGDAMLYCHPWEIDCGQPRLKVPLHIKMVHYYNLKSTYKKLDNLLKNFEFCTMGEIIKHSSYPSYELK